MRDLSNFLRTTEMSKETNDAIKKEAVYLNFNNRHLSINSNILDKAMDLLRDTSGVIDDDYPIHANQLFENDRVASVLSALGYFAPNLFIPSCVSIKLVDGSDPPKKSAWRTVTLSSAISDSDWKVMLKDKLIHNNSTNLSKSFKDRSFIGTKKSRLSFSLLNLTNAQGVASTDNAGLPEMSYGGMTDYWDVIDF